jgi:hypothetical protein
MARWCEANKMAVYVYKTHFVIFRTKGKPVPENKIIIFTMTTNPAMTILILCISELEHYHNKHTNASCKAYKLLDIYFDESFTFNHHINTLCNKLNRPLCCINRAKNSF